MREKERERERKYHVSNVVSLSFNLTNLFEFGGLVNENVRD